MDFRMGKPIPLTTVFTPPSSCSSSWTYEGDYYNSVTGGLLMQNALSSRDPNCFPPFFEGTGRGQIQQVFSPGFCPHGYTSPAATTNDGVTTAVCCPSNYKYFTTLTTINFFSSVTVFAGCISTFPSSSTTTVLARDGQDNLVRSAVTGPISMWGQAVLVQFRSEDLSLYMTASTTSSSSAGTTSGQTSSPSAPANNQQPPPTSPPALPPSNSNQSPGLSPGAKAGIAIGAVSAIVLLLALVIFIRRRNYRRHHSLYTTSQPCVIQELDAGVPRNGFFAPKSEGNPVHEMPVS